MDPLLLLLLLTIIFLLSAAVLAGARRRPAVRLPPGPKGWPILGNLPQLGPKPHHTLHALSQTYGPLLRLRLGSVEVIVASSAAVASEFLRTHDANFSNRPPNSGAEHVAYNYQDMVFAPYGPRWRALRKLCSVHLFSQKALDGLRDVREDEVARMARSVAAAAGSTPVRVGEVVNKCAMNAVARAAMGRRVYVEGTGEFKEMVVELMRLAGVFNIGDFVPWMKVLDLQGVVGKLKRLHKRMDGFLDRVIQENRKAAAEGGGGGGGGGGKDLLSVLVGMKEDGEGEVLTDTEIKALFLNLFTAGTDTSSSTVEWALAELIRHPDILKMAQQELDSVVGRDRLLSEADLPNLPFMQAIIKETFRLHPSTPLSLPRMASEACEVAGYYIPKHATLLVNVWAIARDPAAWPEPLEFRPSRFLPGGQHADVDIRGNDFEVIPFGAGRRICAGVSLGIRMVQFMTATLVHGFDFVLPDGQRAEKLDMEEAYGLTLQRAVPLTVQPIPRLAPLAYETGC